MKNLALIVTSFFIFFLIGIKYERDRYQGEIISVYTPQDIIYADLYNLQIYYQSSDDIHNFSDRKELLDFLENQSAEQAQGMREYQIQIDFDTVSVYDHGRYVDCYITTEPLNQLDEILSMDNR